jgi:predicted CoA-binding protein
MAVDYSIRPMDDINTLRRILSQNRVIAVVGLSADWFRPSYFAAKYMQEHGYTVIPVNPRYREILGQKCYPSLREIPVKVDIVDCFRKTADIMPLCDDAVAIGAKVLWREERGGRGEGARRRPGRGDGPLREDRARAPVRRPELGRGQHPRDLGETSALACLLSVRERCLGICFGDSLWNISASAADGPRLS